MAVLRSKNILFFSYEPVFEDEEYFKVGFVSLDEHNSTGIISGEQILNLGTFDIDQDNKLIYFGGSDGIFLLDTISNKVSFYSSRGDTIAKIFYNVNVYFTKYNEKGVILKNGDYFKTLHEDLLVKNFVVTKYDVFVYLDNSGLHVSKGTERHRISNNAFIRGITIDLDGNVYAWWIDEIYRVVIHKKLDHSKLVRIAIVPNIGAITFDNKNNLLFTSDRSLYMMKENKTGCGLSDDY